ncbi:hypothetical protein TWF281_010404 [Arthrobotrys megalospora]
MAEEMDSTDIPPPPTGSAPTGEEGAPPQPSSPLQTSQPQQSPVTPTATPSSPLLDDIFTQSDVITPIPDDGSRKRKSSETPEIPVLLQSPQKRPRSIVGEEIPIPSSAVSLSGISTVSGASSSPPGNGFQPGPPLPATPPPKTYIPSTPPPRQTSMPPPPIIPPSSSQLYQQPIYPPPPAGQSRENLQFSATDLPKDDDGMMRWLAHRVRDSATLTMDAASQHSPEPVGAGDSDPETRAERERVRAENRERKKKWREENSDRNKDNDLRGRVSRRANKLFGPENSDKKRAWMDDEFNRRKVKREFKTQLKKNETPGSSCWNSNDDFCSDNPSQVMAGVLTNQEGCAENLRNWIENGEIDYETWNAACQRLWGDPGMRAYLENLVPDQQQQQQVIASAAATPVAADGKGEAGQAADDGLASKFDAAFDAIIGRGVQKAAVPVAAVPEISESVGVEDDLLGEMQMEDVVAAALEMEAAVAVEEEQSVDAGNLTVDDLARLIESGDMSLEDIAALEAALRESGMEEEQLGELEDLPGDETILGTLEDGTVDDVTTSEAAMEIHDIDLALPDLHSDHTDISDFHQHLEIMSPNTRDAFIAAITAQDGEDGVALDEMQLDGVLSLEGVEVPTMTETSIVEDVEMEQLGDDEGETTVVMEAAGGGEEGGVERDGEVVDAEATILEFLESAGIKLDELNEEQLQKFINAVSGEGDIEEILAEIQAAQGGHEVPGTEQDVQLPAAEEQQQQTDQSMALAQDDGMMDLTAAQVSGEEEDGMYGDGDDYDEDEEVDLTPDIMRIILQSSGLVLPDVTAVGDAHTLQPTAAQLPLLPPAKPTTTTTSKVSTTTPGTAATTAQQRPLPTTYAYSPARYSYSGYAYGYQKRPEVQVLPPGYSAYSRPPTTVAEPRIPDFGHLIKPLAYKPKKVEEIKEEPAAGGDEGKDGGDSAAVTTAAAGSTATSGDGEKKKPITAGWAEIFKFEIPIPSFLGRGGRRASEQEKMEEERNVRAMGFPPMATELKMAISS